MKELAIIEVETLSSGQIAVRPQESDSMFEFIYRAGAGVEWKDGRFLSPSEFMLSSRANFSAAQNIAALVDALKGELGLRLKLSEQTNWVGTSQEARSAIIAAA